MTIAPLLSGPASECSRPPANLSWLIRWCLAGAVLQLLEMAGDSLVPRSLLTLVGMRLVTSGLGGLAQALVLRRRLRRLPIGVWILLSALGSALALLLVNLLWSATLVSAADAPLEQLLPPTSWIPAPLLLALAGGIIGAAQLPALRGCLTGLAAWPAITALAALVSLGLVGALRSLLGPTGLPMQPSTANPLHWLLSAVAAALAALLSGAFLLWCQPAAPDERA